jgi:hypothetical protein
MISQHNSEKVRKGQGRSEKRREGQGIAAVQGDEK